MVPPPSLKLSEAQARHARAVIAGGQPVAARPASAVVVIRDGVAGSAHTGGIEVYVHRRHRDMTFAAGVVAFPGGGVDPEDLVTPVPGEADWARRLGVEDAIVARSFVAAAVRELAEETGLVVTPADLAPWAHWITPTFQQRRYDTWFFLLALPDDTSPRDVSGETEGVAWVRPADELHRAAAGESMLMPPTRAVLADLAAYDSVAAALAAANGRRVDTVEPSWELDGEHVVLRLPSWVPG